MRRHFTGKTAVALGAALSLYGMTSWAVAAEKIRFNIPPQSLASALNEFGAQSGRTVMFTPDIARTKTSRGIADAAEPGVALAEVLAGTGLTYKASGNAYLIVAQAADPRPAPRRVRSANGGGAAAPEEFKLEEVVVTATKRAQRLQDVPAAVTALDSKQLERVGAQGFEDFVRNAPGLVFNQTDAEQGSFAIRGVTTSVGAGNTQATVALYIDDLPTLPSFAALSRPDLHLFDVERVEVLRGPQGTLFGSGALGGALRVITKKPKLGEFESAFSASYSSTEGAQDGHTFDAMLNVPLGERLAMRAVGYARDIGGYVENVGMDRRDANSVRKRGGRVEFAAELTDRFKLIGTILHQETDAADGGALNAVANGKHVRSTGLLERNRSELTMYNLVAQYDFGGANLLSSTSYAKTPRKTTVDASVGTPFPSPSPYRIGAEANIFTQELRLASNLEGNWSWLVGAFYLRSDNQANFELTVPGMGVMFTDKGDLPSRERALFGEVGYKFAERWQLTLGARWFANQARYIDDSSGALVGGGGHTDRRTQEAKATPKVLLSYTPSRDVLLYAQATQGYRVGQNNLPIPPDSAGRLPPVDYKSDTLWNYEFGAKTAWFDQRLTLNAALYYIDWSDIQLDQTRPDNFNYITNVGKAHTAGLELEVAARPLKGLEATLALALMEAEVDEDNLALSTPARRGDRLPGTPKLTVSAGLDYTHALTEQWNGYGRIDYQYVGKSYGDFARNPAYEMGGYGLVNLRLGAQTGERWDVALFANNLFDSDAVMTALPTPPIATLYLLRPRSVGIDFTARF